MPAQVNVEAAEAEEAVELLSTDGAPYCFSEAGQILKCPVTAQRTVRAGVNELKVRLSILLPKTTPCTSPLV